LHRAQQFRPSSFIDSLSTGRTVLAQMKAQIVALYATKATFIALFSRFAVVMSAANCGGDGACLG